MNGLAAALLGVCAMELSQPITCLSSDPSASPERIAGNTVLEIIGSRIGMASYFSRIDALLQRPEFAQAPGKTPGTDNTAPSKGGLAPLKDWLCPCDVLWITCSLAIPIVRTPARSFIRALQWFSAMPMHFGSCIERVQTMQVNKAQGPWER